MKKTKNLDLSLRRETLRQLTANTLVLVVAGGVGASSACHDSGRLSCSCTPSP
ncbi:MAG TPA: hypothetical protein VIU61_22985 [Kofleriaceae bacterium]